MWKRGMSAWLIDRLPVNNVLKTTGRFIHIIHGIYHSRHLSTFCKQDVKKHFHKVIHALIV